MKKQNSEVEIAYRILQQSGQEMYFRDLITKVLETSGRTVQVQAHAMAEVHTQINMDSRFVHHGKGMWGLLEWTPQSSKYTVNLVAEEAAATVEPAQSRRNKLFEEIQQGYVEQAGQEPDLD